MSYTINPPYSTDNRGTITDFSANFTITSDAGTVTGSNTIDSTLAPGTVSCGRHYRTAGFIVSAIPTTYSAIIATPYGNYRDRGSSTIDLSCAFVQPPAQPINTTSSLNAGFLSALTEPTLIVPTSMDDCKNGGWQTFPQYNNQGHCVAFVASQQGDQKLCSASSRNVCIPIRAHTESMEVLRVPKVGRDWRGWQNCHLTLEQCGRRPWRRVRAEHQAP